MTPLKSFTPLLQLSGDSKKAAKKKKKDLVRQNQKQVKFEANPNQASRHRQSTRRFFESFCQLGG